MLFSSNSAANPLSSSAVFLFLSFIFSGDVGAPDLSAVVFSITGQRRTLGCMASDRIAEVFGDDGI